MSTTRQRIEGRGARAAEVVEGAVETMRIVPFEKGVEGTPNGSARVREVLPAPA